MKVLWLESLGGTQFPTLVGDSCTMQELKEKVQQLLEIPIRRQLLSFNGNILREDADLVDVTPGSVIKFRILNVPCEFPLPDPVPFPAPEPEAEVMDLQLDISPTETITVKTCGDDTVRELKEKIQNKEGTPADQIMLTIEDGTELPDYKRLRDCDLTSGVELEFLPEPRPKKTRLYYECLPSNSSSSSAASSSSSRSRKRARPTTPRQQAPVPPAPAVDEDVMSLELYFRGEKLAAPVEVRSSSMVRELRAKLEAMKFSVPGNKEYCFLHDQIPLDEDTSFEEQEVGDGDPVYIYTPGLTCSLRNVDS